MLEILSWGAKFVRIVDVAIEISEIHNDLYGDDAKKELTEDEKIDLACRIGFVACKSLAIGVEIGVKLKLGDETPSCLRNIQLWSNIAPEMIRLSKPFVKEEKVNPYKATYEIFVCMANAQKIYTGENKCSTRFEKGLFATCDALTCISAGVRVFSYTHPKEFNKACDATCAEIGKAVVEIGKKCEQVRRVYVEVYAKIAAMTKPFNDKYLVFFSSASNKEELEEELVGNKQQSDIIYENHMLYLNGLQLKRIPPQCTDDFLMSIRCKISGEPIRFVVQPTQNDGINDQGNVFYEKVEIELYFEKAEIPPGWPKGLEFKRANIKPNRDLQLKINERLKNLRDQAEKIQEEYEKYSEIYDEILSKK